MQFCVLSDVLIGCYMEFLKTLRLHYLCCALFIMSTCVYFNFCMVFIAELLAMDCLRYGPFLPSAVQHPSHGDCMEVKREYYQNCSVLDCVTQCLQSAAYIYEQFIQVQQIEFVTLGPLCHVYRRLPCIIVTWWSRIQA